MEIREIDVHDDLRLREFYDVNTRSLAEGREGAARRSFEELAAAYRAPDASLDQLVYGAYDGDTLVATGYMFLPLLENTEKCWVYLQVDPAHRRGGLGTAMLSHLTDTAAEAGRTVLCGEALVPFDRVVDHPYRRFAEARGWAPFNDLVVRHLAVPIDEAELTRWAAHAAERHGTGHGEYRIETYVDTLPEALLPGYCHLLGLLGVDAPSGELTMEEETYTPERLAEFRAPLIASGAHVYDTLAISPGGEVVAYSAIQTPPPGRVDAEQLGTYVHREHRGHRLGLATKVANLATVQRDQPGLRRIITQNAETNQWMVAINEQLGFEPFEVSLSLVRYL